MADSQLTLPDGRTLSYIDIGDPDGTCVMHFHGAPSSRLVLDVYDDEFAEQGVRVVAPDRPSYGGSSPHPGRTMAAWPTDVDALADALGIDECAVSGLSSGGPYVVACCALLPDRVMGGLVLAGATDMSWPEAAEGYPAVELEIMALDDEAAAIDFCAERFGPDGSGYFEEDPFEWPEPDEAFLSDERTGAHLAQAMGEAFAQGVDGYAQDMIVQGQPWPFEPESIDAPVRVLHGELDDLVPMAHSRHTAAMIPDAELEILPGHGHLSVLDEFPALAGEFVRSLGTSDTR